MTEENNYGFSDAWSLSEEYPGYMVKTIVVDNVTCDILRPILTEAERNKRARQAMRELARIVAPYIEDKEEKTDDKRTA